MVEISILDSDYEEIESSIIEAAIPEAIAMIDKISEFVVAVEDTRLRYEKSGWVSVDFKEKRIEIQLKTE